MELSGLAKGNAKHGKELLQNYRKLCWAYNNKDYANISSYYYMFGQDCLNDWLGRLANSTRASKEFKQQMKREIATAKTCKTIDDIVGFDNFNYRRIVKDANYDIVVYNWCTAQTPGKHRQIYSEQKVREEAPEHLFDSLLSEFTSRWDGYVFRCFNNLNKLFKAAPKEKVKKVVECALAMSFQDCALNELKYTDNNVPDIADIEALKKYFNTN